MNIRNIRQNREIGVEIIHVIAKHQTLEMLLQKARGEMGLRRIIPQTEKTDTSKSANSPRNFMPRERATAPLS